MGLQQTKNLLHHKRNINKTKKKPIEWENIFANDTSDQRLILKIKDLYNSTLGRQTTQFKNGQRN